MSQDVSRRVRMLLEKPGRAQRCQDDSREARPIPDDAGVSQEKPGEAQMSQEETGQSHMMQDDPRGERTITEELERSQMSQFYRR